MIGSKYLAIVDRYSSENDSAICTILAMQESNNVDGFVIEEEELLSAFHGSKQVFVPKIRRQSLKDSDIFSFTLIEVFTEKKLPRVHHSELSHAKTSLCLELKKISVDGHFLDIESLGNDINTQFPSIDAKFYASDGNNIYGDFKFDKGKVAANKGVEVMGYNSNYCLKIDHPHEGHENISILLYIAKDTGTKFDCSGDTQLIDRVKDIIGKTRLSDESRRYINHIKSLITEDGLGDFELAKIKKVQQLLDKVTVKYEEFEALRNNSEFWSKVFDNSLQDFESRLTTSFLENNKVELDNRLKIEYNKLDDIKTRTAEKQRLLDNLNEISDSQGAKVQFLKNQIETLEKNKDQIILQIQIQSQISSSASRVQFLQTFEIQKSENISDDFYGNIDDLVNDIDDQVKLSSQQEDDLVSAIECLQNSNFFRADNATELLQLLHSLGNAQLYISDTGADWIKFNKLLHQGLLEAFKFAHDQSAISVYYILQDYNLASPEIYAKPVIDISRNVRKSLPPDGRPWPINLRVVFIPLELNIDDFGFSVNDQTFRGWKTLTVPSIPYQSVSLKKAFNFEDKF